MKKTFTLSEVLITLVIIGIIAAITVPVVMAEYQKKAYVTKLKKAYSSIQSGFKLSMANSGVFELADSDLFDDIRTDPGTSSSTSCSIGQVNYAFKSICIDLTNEFARIFNAQISKTPKNYIIKYFDKSGQSDMSNRPLLIFPDGMFAIIQIFYFEKTEFECQRVLDYGGNKSACIKLGSVTIDINGDKGPNTYGKDVYAFSIGNNGLRPVGSIEDALSMNVRPLSSNGNYWKTSGDCGKENLTKGGVKMGYRCAARIMDNGWEIDY